MIRFFTICSILFFARALPAVAAESFRTSPTSSSAEILTRQEKEVLLLAEDFARRCGEALEKWIASKEVTEDRLFSGLYFPVPRTDPPKFTTGWDHLADRDILAIEEEVLSRSGAITFAVMVDRFGYLPTHNRRYSMPLTGNLASDLLNNRTKRIFNDATGLAAARNVAPFLLQQYKRDTGEIMEDLSVPITVRGAHWGAVRIGFRAIADGPANPRAETSGR